MANPKITTPQLAHRFQLSAACLNVVGELGDHTPLSIRTAALSALQRHLHPIVQVVNALGLTLPPARSIYVAGGKTGIGCGKLDIDRSEFRGLPGATESGGVAEVRVL